MSGDVIPGRFCEKCGRPLHAVQMDVGYVEVLCLYCDSGQPDYEEEDEKTCATCKHFDIERDGEECDIYGIAESIWSCEKWEGEE